MEVRKSPGKLILSFSSTIGEKGSSAMTGMLLALISDATKIAALKILALVYLMLISP
jgi:hypothetical protein